MANNQHLTLLKQGVPTWNEWRQKNPKIRPDLSEADLRGADLSKAKLHGVTLYKANLEKADLWGVNLAGADLSQANLRGANLEWTNLREANLHQADLSGVDLSRADLAGVNLSQVDLSRADLGKTKASLDSNSRLIALLKRAPKDRLEAIYERHGIDRKDGVETLVKEICLDGANTIASFFRGGEGVPYREVVQDVAAKLGVDDKIRDNRDETVIERAILDKVIEKYLKTATAEQREEIKKVFEEAAGDGSKAWSYWRAGTFTAAGGAVMLRLVSEILLRQGIIRAGSQVVRLAGFAVPFLNVLLIGWTVLDLAGPAFRRTIPTMIEIALLRLEYGE